MLNNLTIDNINNKINKNILLKQKYKDLQLINNNYDCFEFQLLKILQLVFATNNIINKTNLYKWMDRDKLECNELIEFFKTFPNINHNELLLKDTWLNLLAIKPFIKKSPIENLYDFFETFFPKLILEGNNDQEKLSNLYLKLNFNFESLDVQYETYQKIEGTTIHKKWTQNIIINGICIIFWEITTIFNFTKFDIYPIFNKSEFINL